ncbi:hypothetical protein SAMN05216553_13113 [Lentzea fradiae]|uniref:Uncharacterized protein n=1 Tax=Lentzea fradiae TaxID=200378 RepID=A0A1G8DLL8_9PSEU|nr:hypothetical protein [Lentzea fradiae]SDH58576.1 hypothetical protein SAMN05216553_13113 [Lentzea fradiae]
MLKLMISPGPAASADIVAWPDSAEAEHCLRLNLDPAQIAIHVPNGPGGREQLAAFLRTLSQHAGLLAAVLDPAKGAGWIGNTPTSLREQG